MCRDFGERGENRVRRASGATWGPQAWARTRALFSWTGVRGGARSAKNVETAHIPPKDRRRGQAMETAFYPLQTPAGRWSGAGDAEARVEGRATAPTREDGEAAANNKCRPASGGLSQFPRRIRHDWPDEPAGRNVGSRSASPGEPSLAGAGPRPHRRKYVAGKWWQETADALSRGRGDGPTCGRG